MCEGFVAMGDLVGAEVFHARLQIVVAFDAGNLACIMLVDHFLDGRGASHGRGGA